jgi:hypothetical protein
MIFSAASIYVYPSLFRHSLTLSGSFHSCLFPNASDAKCKAILHAALHKGTPAGLPAGASLFECCRGRSLPTTQGTHSSICYINTFTGYAYLVRITYCDGAGTCHRPNHSNHCIEVRCPLTPGLLVVRARASAVFSRGSIRLIGRSRRKHSRSRPSG